MAPTIAEIYDLPSPEELRTMGFVVKLSARAPADSPAQRQLVDEYVLTPTVRHALPGILDDMKRVTDRGEEYGRIIHGSFGSGKSHFLTFLSLLIENASSAWDKDDPTIRDMRGHREWLAAANLLVVRAHMLSLRGTETGLDDALYRAYNDALRRRGVSAPFEPLNAESVLAEVRREAELYGDAVWQQLAEAGIVGSREEFETLEPEDHEGFARAYLALKGRAAASAGIHPPWAEGLGRLADHAREHGFGGIVFMIDELLLWLAEKSGRQFARQIHDLNLLVDHSTGQRAVPVFAFVARQRNISDFFPDLTSEDEIHEHLDHHAERFGLTELRDVELRHIVHGRVLRPRDPARVEAAIAELVADQHRILPALLANADVGYLKDVYPFHPALIEMLVDASSLMQRERSALRLLYELLVANRDLPLGKFLPLGSAFAVIFPAAGVEASQHVDLFREIHRQYHQRLVPQMAAMAGDEQELDANRHRALDQLIKTILLAEISPRLRGDGLTIERLVRLNVADVVGPSERSRIQTALHDLRILSRRVPELQISGDKAAAVVRYTLERVSLSAYLERARSKDNPPARLRALMTVLKPMLGIAGRKGFERDYPPLSGEYKHEWRKTTRTGIVQVCNVREARYEEFETRTCDFRILVDYPWDEPGHTVDEDRLRARNAAKERGHQYAICWLPRHLTGEETEVVRELSAVEYLLSEAGRDELIRDLGTHDQQKILSQAETRRHSLRHDFTRLLRKVYVEHGEVLALTTGVDDQRPSPELDKDLEHFATVLLDRRYPSHPHLAIHPTRKDLERLLDWLRAASEAGATGIEFDSETGKLLRQLGQPLELVELGQTRGTLRLDSRYVKDVLRRADASSVRWSEIAEHLAEAHGFQAEIRELFLGFLCARGYRALNETTGEPLELSLRRPLKVPVRLERTRLMDLAPWGRLRDLAEELFALPRPPAHRSLREQDRLAADLRRCGRERREVLQGLHQRLADLGLEADRPRPAEVREAIRRLQPLAVETTDSYATLEALLADWPDDRRDPLRRVVAQAETSREALAELSESDRKSLVTGRSHAGLGSEVAAHLDHLEELLGTEEVREPLTRGKIGSWNEAAHALVQRLIATTVKRDDEPVKTPVRELFEDHPVDLSTAAGLDDFLTALRQKLAAVGKALVRIDVRVRPEDER